MSEPAPTIRPDVELDLPAILAAVHDPAAPAERAAADQDHRDVVYPPTDHDGWRRRSRALARLHTALAAAERASVGPHDQWRVTLVEPSQLTRWLGLVEALVPAPEPNTSSYTQLRIWTGDVAATEPPEAQAVVYAELRCADPALAGTGAVDVTCMLYPPGQDAARADHPQLRAPRAEADVARATWLRYVTVGAR